MKKVYGCIKLAFILSRTFTLLIREILSGSVFLPSMDYLADPVSAEKLQVICVGHGRCVVAYEMCNEGERGSMRDF